MSDEDESSESETEYEKCGKCTYKIKTLSISCDGFCNQKYHLKCAKGSYQNAKFVAECENYKFYCDECIKNPETMMVNKSVKNTLRFMCMLDERMKRQEISNENVLKQLECLNSIVKQICDSMQSGTNIHESNKIETYASVTKNYPNECVVIKPKTKQKNTATRSEMNKKLTKPVNVCNVKNVSNGGVLIKCKSVDDSQKIKDEVMLKLGDKYTVTVPTKRYPKIKVAGMSEEMSNDGIVELIQSQILMESRIKVLSVYENRRHKNYGAIVEVDPVTFEKAMDKGKLFIGWDVCKITEYINVKRCFNCCGFNHAAKNCKRKKACLKCGGQHILKDCKSERSECVNCKNAVNKLQLKIDVNHPAWSKECATFKNKIELERRHISYMDQN